MIFEEKGMDILHETIILFEKVRLQWSLIINADCKI